MIDQLGIDREELKYNLDAQFESVMEDIKDLHLQWKITKECLMRIKRDLEEKSYLLLDIEHFMNELNTSEVTNGVS